MHKMGCLKELPDPRDYDAAEMFKVAPMTPIGDVEVVDVRKHCSPIENQGQLGSCTAQAIVGMAEYYERRRWKKHIDASRLFVYKLARQLDGFTGDTGSYIRSGMKALRLFGAPPERYWPYDIERFDEDPPAIAFAYGQSLQGLYYYRLDCGDRDRPECLALLKKLVASEYPVAFGFLVYSFGNEDGEFPMPEPGQTYYGGHAVMACGYDDNRVIGESTGAILIRNSWGTSWGQDGYGWLPYDYVLKSLSWDFWTLRYKEAFMG